MPGIRCPISIIIPVYNNEKTLADCLGSILNQGSEEFEIILINNGSIDGSVGICEDYRAKDHRVKVIHMEHDAAAVAYNKGLEAAIGKYVHFASASDYIKESAFKKISPFLLQNLDVIFLEAATKFWDVSHTNALRRLNREVPNKLWDKLIRRELLTKDDIWFSTGAIWEIADFCIKLYLHAATYGTIDFPYYHRHEESLDNNIEAAFGKIIMTLSKWTGPAESAYEEYGTIIHNWMAIMYCDLLIPMFSRLPPDARKSYKPGMMDFQWLLDTDKTRKNQTVKILFSVFGPLITSKFVQYKNRYVSSSKAYGIGQVIHK